MFENVCKLDFILKPDEIKYINEDQVYGVYVLFIKGEPMYIGRSENLKKRLYSHFNRNSCETRDIINEVDEVGIKFPNKRDYFEIGFLESIFIFEYNPPINKKRNKFYLYKLLLNNYTKKCKAKFDDGTPCIHYAHSNGYCNIHGGNKLTREYLVKNKVDELVKNNIQLKFII